jgi:hypothetical protein
MAYVALPVTHRYNALHMRQRAPYPRLPLNSYRKVMVTDRKEHPERPGPCDEGAAIIMGNTARPTWDNSYWYRRRQALAEQAAANMGVYRSELLREATGTGNQ